MLFVQGLMTCVGLPAARAGAGAGGSGSAIAIHCSACRLAAADRAASARQAVIRDGIIVTCRDICDTRVADDLVAISFIMI